MSNTLSQAENDRNKRLKGVECCRNAIIQQIESYRGLAAYNDWAYTETEDMGLQFTYSRNGCVFTSTIERPLDAIHKKSPLSWHFKLEYERTLVSEVTFTINTMVRVEMWTTLNHMARFLRNLIRRGDVYIARGDGKTREELMYIGRQLNIVEYQVIKIMATGVLALFTRELDLARLVL